MSKAIKVLVVDDDFEILNAMFFLLQHWGFEVEPLHDWTVIGNIIHDFKPDLLIMDFYLKGKTGGEVCKMLRHQGYETPIIIYSGATHKIDFAECGADDFIAKPFEMEDVVEKVKLLVNPK